MEETEEEGRNKLESLKLKFIAIASILVLGAIGVCIPILGKSIPALNLEKDIFFMIKAFAAGVIFSAGCVYVLADAIENLNSPCLNQDYPWALLIMMMSAVATFTLDKGATGYYNRSHFMNKGDLPVSRDQEQVGEHAGHVHVHTHATHGHSHGSALLSSDVDDLIRHRVVSQLGIVVHSVIIGIGLGTSQSPSTIKSLIAALTFHQFFEGL